MTVGAQIYSLFRCFSVWLLPRRQVSRNEKQSRSCPLAFLLLFKPFLKSPTRNNQKLRSLALFSPRPLLLRSSTCDLLALLLVHFVHVLEVSCRLSPPSFCLFSASGSFLFPLSQCSVSKKLRVNVCVCVPLSYPFRHARLHFPCSTAACERHALSLGVTRECRYAQSK